MTPAAGLIAAAAVASTPGIVARTEIEGTLVALASTQAERRGLHLDASRVRFVTVPSLPSDGQFTIAPSPEGAAPGDGAADRSFMLRQVQPASRAGITYRVLLHAPLTRDVWVTRGRHPRGSSLACDDLCVERVDARRVPRDALDANCALPAASVASRELGVGEVVRRTDAGPAADVAAHQPVRVSSVVAGIVVEMMGTALAQGRRGDRLSVRLEHPRRVVDGVVIEAGVVSIAQDPR